MCKILYSYSLLFILYLLLIFTVAKSNQLFLSDHLGDHVGKRKKKKSPISCQESFGQILALLIRANLKQQSAPVSGTCASFGSSSGNCALSFGLSFFTKPGLCPGMWRPDLDRCCSEPFADERPRANSPSQLKNRERQLVQIVH